MLGHLLYHSSSPPLFSISKSTQQLFTIKCGSSNSYNYYKQISSFNKTKNSCICSTKIEKSFSTILSNNLIIPLAIAVALITPLPSSAIPSLNSKSFSLPSTTPFSQARNLTTGLENGKIRTCPSINPGCVSTNPMSSNFAFPWSIQGSFSDSVAIQKLEDAILKTQKNAKIELVEDTTNGKYLKAEVDGGFGRDVLEFLVKGDVVSYRAMATKVTYIYPFTTALGDSKGQEERMKQIVNELGWYGPSFDSMD